MEWVNITHKKKALVRLGEIDKTQLGRTLLVAMARARLGCVLILCLVFLLGGSTAAPVVAWAMVLAVMLQSARAAAPN